MKNILLVIACFLSTQSMACGYDDYACQQAQSAQQMAQMQRQQMQQQQLNMWGGHGKGN